MTVTELKELCEKLIKEKKGHYKVVNGEYNLTLSEKNFEVDDNISDPCVIIW